MEEGKDTAKEGAGAARPPIAAPVPQPVKEAAAEPGVGPHAKPGFVTIDEDGRLWIFRAGSKELAAFKKDGELAKQVVLISSGPGGVTVKGPDRETILAYLAACPGFETLLEDGRIWAFKSGSKELTAFRKDGEFAKHITRIGVGPLGVTVKAPDAETLDLYLKTMTPAK